MSARRFTLPCGGLITPDMSGELSERGEAMFSLCSVCFCVIGSIGMPRDCYEMLRAEPQSSGEDK